MGMGSMRCENLLKTIWSIHRHVGEHLEFHRIGCIIFVGSLDELKTKSIMSACRRRMDGVRFGQFLIKWKKIEK